MLNVFLIVFCLYLNNYYYSKYSNKERKDFRVVENAWMGLQVIFTFDFSLLAN